MAEYVYARHDFVPEHEDEIAFRAGERIEVIERDDLYSDGWWQGRNLAGNVGLFPESYTQPAPPSTGPPPAPVPPSSGPADKPRSPAASLHDIEPAPLQPVPGDPNHSETTVHAESNQISTGINGEVMRATLTDVQQAIEQLGHKDDDGSQSFTFSSSHDDSTDHEMDHDTDADADGQDWHRGARQKLAEKAKKAVEEQAARDAAEDRMPMRSMTPPINIEVSDDSGDEGDGPSGGPHAALHGHVNHHPTYSPSIQPSERFIVPSPVSTAPHPESEINEDAATEAGNELVRPLENNSLLPSPVSPSAVRGISNGISGNDPANHSSSARLAFPSKSQTLSLQEGAGVLPSPAASLNGHQHGYSISSITSSTRVAASSPLSASRNADYSTDRKPRNAHPVEWTVEEVVEWLRSKGFDEVQEITGDVLLELDLAILKSEIGITAYGKRIRIANAIADLRRPPSILSSSAEQHTRPGSLSRGSPLTQQGNSQSPTAQGSVGLGSLVSPESPPDSGDLTGPPAPVGLGLGIPPSLLAGGSHNKAAKGRPPQLSLSPSDPALGANAMEEDSGVMSDSATKGRVTKSRSKLFGRQNSSSSTGKMPSSQKEVTTPRSDITPIDDGVRLRHQPRKRSLDTARENSRLSFFGTTIAGTLSKARKPPPRYSSGTPDPEVSPDRSVLSLSRLYYSSGSRKTSRSAASDGKEDKREKRDSKDSKKDSTLLRKPASPTIAPATGSFKSGQSILAQIGQPDHEGWMRKRGENYNTWKNRYFVLKGPHLYWLKSDSASETKVKGYINIVGYRMFADENIDPGKYGFKLLHESDRSHFFSSDEQMVIREWMRALMKATIDRDYTKPVVSSVNVPTIPLTVAQAMNPAPRPPSPTARAATQRAMRRENTNQLSTRDAEILMSMAPPTSPSSDGGNRPRIESFFSELEAEDPITPPTNPRSQAPPVRPPREMRRQASTSEQPLVEPDLIEWANNHLPGSMQITSKGSICGGLELLRIAESIKGVRSNIPDRLFPRGPNDNKVDGLLNLFDFLLDNGVKMGTRDKIIQLLKALREWEEKRLAVLQSIGKSSMQAGPFVG
ncbi:hypothetical protein BJV77DRAFT_1024192 [Russula vinacea]|nr:hypothetical protein BJV77DRAFT_1024192 [Russula vinacea]